MDPRGGGPLRRTGGGGGTGLSRWTWGSGATRALRMSPQLRLTLGPGLAGSPGGHWDSPGGE